MTTFNESQAINPKTSAQVDHLVANLLDFFRRTENHDDWFKASSIALNLVSRLSLRSPTLLEKRFVFFASRLKNNVSLSSIRYFATECINAAMKVGCIKESKYTPSPKASSDHAMKRRAIKNINNAIAKGVGYEDAIKYASNKLIKEKTERDRDIKRNHIINAHPLKDTLQNLQGHKAPIAKEDIRNHLLHLKRKSSPANPHGGSLYRLLEKTQSFSAPKLHKLLGDELYFLCRPLGFHDRNDTILVVEVPSSSHLHMLTYRKPEVIKALQKDPTFRYTTNIRFKVRGSQFD